MTDAKTLTDRLIADRAKRPAILTACERLIDDEVNDKGGLSGMGIKVAYKVVCAVKPGIIRESMDDLLDDFVRRLEPFWDEHVKAAGEPSGFGSMLVKRQNDVANALLGITDERAARAKNATLKGAYQKLRPEAVKHVTAAIPRVGKTLMPFL